MRNRAEPRDTLVFKENGVSVMIDASAPSITYSMPFKSNAAKTASKLLIHFLFGANFYSASLKGFSPA